MGKRRRTTIQAVKTTPHIYKAKSNFEIGPPHRKKIEINEDQEETKVLPQMLLSTIDGHITV
jgi:hypothetical protein